MQPKLRWLIALMFSLLLMAPVGMVAAEDDDDGNESKEEKGNDSDDDEDDDNEDELKHKVEVDVSGDEITVEMKQESGESESKIEFKTDLSEAKFKLKFEEETGQVETEQKLEVVLQRLFEYRDANGNGAYDDGETVVSAYRIGGSGDSLSDAPDSGQMNWATPTIADHQVGAKSGKKMGATATFGPNGSGEFGLDMMVFGDFTNLASGQLKPTDVKIDFIIKHYPYEADDTAIGLLLKTKTKQEVEMEHEDIENDEEGITASSTTDVNQVTLMFAWKQSATIDGVDLPVATTVLSSAMESEQDGSESEFEYKKRFVISYARGDVIVHDPVAGVGYGGMAATDAGWLDALMPGFTTLLATASISVAAIALRPRRKMY